MTVRTIRADASVCDAIRQVAKHASRDRYRPILRGVWLEAHHVIATDSYRLSVVELDPDCAPLPHVILPLEAVKQLPRGGEWRARVRRGCLCWDDVVVPLVEETTPRPDWPSLIPDGPLTKVTYLRARLVDWLDEAWRARPAGTTNVNRDHCYVTLAGRWVEFAAGRPGLREWVPTRAETILDGHWADKIGPPLPAVFLYPNLRDALTIGTSEQVTIELGADYRKPIVVREDDLVHVLMPCRPAGALGVAVEALADAERGKDEAA